LDQGLTQRVELGEDPAGLPGGGLRPAAQRRMVGNLFRGQQCRQQLLDLPQADAHGLGRDGQTGQTFAQRGQRGGELGVGVVELLPQRSILGAQVVELVLVEEEALFEEARMVVDGLARTSGNLGLGGDGPVAVGKDGGSVADPGAQG